MKGAAAWAASAAAAAACALILSLLVYASPLRPAVYRTLSAEYQAHRQQLAALRDSLARLEMRIHMADAAQAAVLAGKQPSLWRRHAYVRARTLELAAMQSSMGRRGLRAWLAAAGPWPLLPALLLLPVFRFAVFGRDGGQSAQPKTRPARATRAAPAARRTPATGPARAPGSAPATGRTPATVPARANRPAPAHPPSSQAGEEPGTSPEMEETKFMRLEFYGDPMAKAGGEWGKREVFLQGESGGPITHVFRELSLSMEDEEQPAPPAGPAGAEPLAEGARAPDMGGGFSSGGEAEDVFRLKEEDGYDPVQKQKNEVLRLARRGLTSSEISRRLRLSQDEVEMIIRLKREKGG